MRTLTGPRLLGIALLAVAALGLAGCGGGAKRRVTTTVTTTTPARIAPPVAGVATGSGVASGSAVASEGDASQRSSGSTAAKPAPSTVDHGQTRGHLVAGAVGFGILSQGIVDSGIAGGTAVAGGAGLAGAAGGQCQNPFGTQAAANGQLICSADQERLQCQCDADGCRLVPTGIMSCLPVGAVYQ